LSKPVGQRRAEFARTTGQRLGLAHRIEHRLLGCFGCSSKQDIDPALMDDRDRHDLACLVVIDRLCGGEAERDIATAVPPKRTQPRQAGATPLDDAF